MAEGIDVSKLRKELLIDRTKLDQELSEQAAKYLFVAERAIHAEHQYKLFEAQMEAELAELGVQLRDEINAKEGKCTEKRLEMALASHPRTRTLTQKLSELRSQREVLKALRESWHMRKDMVIQMCITVRTEIAGLNATVKEAA